MLSRSPTILSAVLVVLRVSRGHGRGGCRCRFRFVVASKA